MFEIIKHHGGVALEAWKQDRERIKAEKGLAKATRAEIEFLPAAIEVMEKPASPLGRIVAMAICALFVITIAWGFLGELDTHASAQSKLIAAGHTKVIQALEIGVVKTINVEDGQTVKKGDVLIELDSTDSGADSDRLEADLKERRITIARLRALLEDVNQPLTKFNPPEGSGLALIKLHQNMLRNAAEQHRATIQSLSNQLTQRRAEKRSIEATLSGLKQMLPLTKERAVAVKTLTDQGHFPKLRYLEIKQEEIQQTQELESQRHRLSEVDGAIGSIIEQRSQAVAELRRSTLDELAGAEREASATEQELVKAKQRRSRTTLTSPLDGVVQQLAVHTVGGVVQSAEPLMVIVPGANLLELEAKVLNKDIGFVHKGQDVEIKLETFPFTKYGTVPGKVLHISGDAIQDEQMGPVYTARVSVDRKYVSVNGNKINLTPGMSATAEIKTGKRQLIEYIMAPLFRYRDEALRER